MVATPWVILLGQILPTLAAFVGAIAGMIGIEKAKKEIIPLLEKYFSDTADVKVDDLKAIRDAFNAEIAALEKQGILTTEGYRVDLLKSMINAAIQVEIDNLTIPKNLPSFATIEAVRAYWNQQATYYGQGYMTYVAFAAITAWCNQEITRLTIAPPAAPPVTPPSVPAGAVYQPGTILHGTGYFPWYFIVMSVTLINGVITYQLYNITAASSITYTQAELVGFNLAVVTTVPLADPTARSAELEALTLQNLALQAEVLNLSQAMVTALGALASSLRTVVVTSPDVTVELGDTVVQAAPAPNVKVDNLVDTSSIASMLGLLPMLGVGALSSVSAGTWGNISHGMALGRNQCYGSTAAQLIANMLPTALGIFSMKTLQSDAGIGGWVKEQAVNWIDGLVDPRKYTHVETMDDLVDNASKKLRDAMSFGLQAHMWSVLAESNFVLKNLGLGQVAGFMADMAGFQRLAVATIGVVEQAALTTPARYLANQQLRPNIPGMGDLEEMYAKKEIPLKARKGVIGLSEALALQGFSQEWIDVYSEYLWKDPRLGEVIRIGQFFSPALVPELAYPDAATATWMRNAGIDAKYINSSDWYFAWRAAKGGYDPRDVRVLVETAKRATARREQTLFLDGVTRLARDGFITEARSRELILEAWEFSNPIEARLSAIELQKDYKVLSDTRSVLLLSMAKGLITRDEARDQLSALGLTDERVELEVLKATLGMIPGMRLEISRPEEVLEEAGMEVA